MSHTFSHLVSKLCTVGQSEPTFAGLLCRVIDVDAEGARVCVADGSLNLILVDPSDLTIVVNFRGPGLPKPKRKVSPACEFEQSECDECTSGHPERCHRA